MYKILLIVTTLFLVDSFTLMAHSGTSAIDKQREMKAIYDDVSDWKEVEEQQNESFRDVTLQDWLRDIYYKVLPEWKAANKKNYDEAVQGEQRVGELKTGLDGVAAAVNNCISELDQY
ncbi:MAG TPA: hypothetical protein QGF02_02175 [Candidatus Babeliales bacterium]|nr:hypothetical protein [Candidatus Babeliales bacterium]